MRNDGIKQPSLEWKRKEENTAALVMIHGFTGSPFTTWGNFSEVLSRCESLREWDIALLRYQTHLMPDIAGIWSAEAPLGRLAMMLNTTVTQGELADYPVLAFVAHSMGGLILQQALVGNPELAARTSHVFMFGTPSAGLRKARFLKLFKRQSADMAIGSSFITRLRAEWTETFGRSCPFKLFIVAGETDEFVPPESSLDSFPRCNQYVVAGNHCEIVGPNSDQDPSVQLVVRGIIGDAAPAGPWNAARVALESRQFQEAIRLLEPQKHLLDPAASVTLALALEAVGRQQDAIALLESACGRTSTDAIGVLAGRLKRRWLLSRRNEDTIRATALYQEA